MGQSKVNVEDGKYRKRRDWTENEDGLGKVKRI